MVGASYRFRIKPGMTEVGLNPEVGSNDIASPMGEGAGSGLEDVKLTDSALLSTWHVNLAFSHLSDTMRKCRVEEEVIDGVAGDSGIRHLLLISFVM
jgi:hypothetical protein